MIALIFIAALVCFSWWGFIHAYQQGLKAGRAMATKQEISYLVRASDIRVTIDWPAVERMLDHRGLIAVPKGADFQLRERA